MFSTLCQDDVRGGLFSALRPDVVRKEIVIRIMATRYEERVGFPHYGWMLLGGNWFPRYGRTL